MAKVLNLIGYGIKPSCHDSDIFDIHNVIVTNIPAIKWCTSRTRSEKMRTLNDSLNVLVELHALVHRCLYHDDVIKWNHFPRYWPFVRGIHRWPVNSPHKGQWRRALMFSSICAWANGWENNRDAGHLRHHRALDDVTMIHIIIVIILLFVCSYHVIPHGFHQEMYFTAIPSDYVLCHQYLVNMN